MSLYGSDRGRHLRPNELVAQSQDPQYPGASRPMASTSIPVPQYFRSRIARPAYVTANRSTSSASETEEGHRVMIPTSSSSSNNNARPSLIPQPTGGFSPIPQRRLSTNLSATTQHMQPPTVVSATPGAAESSTQGPPMKDRPRNVLRRKAPLIGRNPERNKRLSGLSDVEILRANMATKTIVLPSQFPESQGGSRKVEESSTSRIPKQLASLSTHNLPPPTPHFASASSPSTCYSESPGIWSRESTPTSLSSYSPGIVQPTKVGYRLRQPSPTQPRLPVPSRPLAASPHIEGTEASTHKLQYLGKTQTPDPSVRSNRKDPQQDLTDVKDLRKSPAPPPRKSSVDFKSPARKTSDNIRSKKQEEERWIKEAERCVFSSHLPSHTSAHQGRPTMSLRTLTKTPPQEKKAMPSPPSKRFGIFAKKSKSTTDPHHGNLGDQHTRRGPAAGTGHEGYGKYAQRGQRTSIGSTSSSRGRSTSMTRSTTKSASSSKSSLHKGLGIDDFLLDRLKPVVISGGGMDGAELLRTQSEQSIGPLSNTSTANLTTTYAKNTKQGAYSTSSLVPPPGPVDRPPKSVSLRQDPSSIQTENEKLRPTIGKRISFRRSQLFGRKSAEPSVSSSGPRADIQGSRSLENSSSVSILPNAEPAISVFPDTKGKNKENPVSKPTLRTKTSRWNFFQRSQGLGRGDPVQENVKPRTPELHVAVAPIPGSRTLPHYALLDTSSDSLDDILHHVEESPPTEAEDRESSVEVGAALNIRERHESVLLPSPPLLQVERFREGRSSPKVYFRRDAQDSRRDETVQTARPSRLASVGRIPPVISRRDRHHMPATQSFSRPFSREDAPSLTVTADQQEQQYVSNRPPLGIQTDVLPSRPFYSEPETAKPFSAPVPAAEFRFPAGGYTDNEFLAFSPRKESVVSGSSSSEGKLSLAAVTAVVPEPGSKPTEDEVWNEYDDLIDDVLSPETSNIKAANECEAEECFQLATKASRTLQAELNAYEPNRATSHLEDPDQTSARSSASSVRLRRSRIAPILHSSISPYTQVSFSELISGYAERNTESMDLTPQDDQSTGFQGELRSPSISRSTGFETSRHRNTVMFDLAERERSGAIAQANLRSGSLMTSRWLSFGRVLFSPAHNMIKSREQERILVIDGLGNDDWSFYCALTYPTATVYSLITGPSPSPSTNPAAWEPPANHHTVHHENMDSDFPFPRRFFSACVLRFPAACSEAVQRNMVSECKRVLRPGGYLEMSILDLDLVNMGNRTRRSIRMLKERICLADPGISLKPASDSIQRLLGRRGFENLHRCMVSIPVARAIAGSSDSSSSNRSFTAGTAQGSMGHAPSASQARAQQKSPSDDGELSLGDLLSDPSPSASYDESIAKIVAKVGRWWFTRCYEMSVLPDGDLDRSIWADKKLLRECQKQGTGFRLLIGYAQKPSEVKRRTASV